MAKRSLRVGDLEDLKLLTVREIAGVLRVSKMTVYRLVRSGDLNGAMRIGRSFRVPESVVHEYLKTAELPGGLQPGRL